MDRDRLIAVTLGESDIRETMFRQRMYLTKNPEMMYEEEQNFKILLQQGEHEIRRGAYDKALAYLDKAVRVETNNQTHCADLLQIPRLRSRYGRK